MDPLESRQLASVLASAGVRADVADAERLPSASNPVYRVGGVVARLPSRARVGVDRSVEVANMRRAHAIGVAPPVLAWDLDGSLVTELLEGEAMRPVDGARHIREVATLLQAVHRSTGFAGRHDPWAMSDALAATGATDARCDRLAEVLEAVRFDPTASAPCHGDPWPGNIVVSGPRSALVDWEYSGMGDPLWDLADFAVECDLDDDDEARLASAYFGQPPDERTIRRIRIYRSLSDLMWARWSIAEQQAGNVADDFAAEARRRSERGLAAAPRL